MSATNENTRIFRIEDVLLLGEAKVNHNLLVKDMPDFIAFDPDFGGNFAQNYMQQISAAEDLETDEMIMDQMEQATAKVIQKLEACRTKFKLTKHFIEKAFPNAKSVQIEFGYKAYYSASRSQAKMIQFMKELYAVANKHQQELIAVGYSQAMIDEINDLQNQLDEANKAQELFGRNRSNLTNERVTAFNAVWETLVMVCRVGKIIYAEDAAKFKQYMLPKRMLGRQNNLIKHD